MLLNDYTRSNLNMSIAVRVASALAEDGEQASSIETDYPYR
jgi:hypothetical protein